MSNPFREWREVHGLTRTEMAVLLGTNVSQIQAVETGMPNRPFKSFLSALQLIIGKETVQLMVDDYVVWREDQRLRTLSKIQ